MKEYIEIGKLNVKLLKERNINLITDKVIFTFERMGHVADKRTELYKEVKSILPSAIYHPDYIYKDWNNRDNTLVFIKTINEESKLNVVIKIAIINDKKHSQNSIMTMIKIGEKTFRKIYKNKRENLLYEKLDKNE